MHIIWSPFYLSDQYTQTQIYDTQTAVHLHLEK